MATRIKKTDLARDALYDKVNTMIDEVNTKIDNKDSLPSQTGNAGKFLTTDGTNASWGKVKQIEIKQNLTNPSADTVPSTKAVSDESSRITTLMDTKISNCITKIPQDIKLELNNGTLTLKAGSKVYVPNGIYPATGKGKFELVSIDSDISTQGFHDGQTLILATCSNLNTTSIFDLGDALVTNTYTYSNTGSSTNGMVYLNTSNFIYFYENGEKKWRYSLPLAICTRTNGKITSINQVFNGFGYIGSTVFALPGVKGLIPNGRNANGSLRSIKFTLDKVLTETFPNLDVPVYVTLKTNSLDYWQVAVTPIAYSETENLFINGNNIKISELILGISYLSSGKITSFVPKTVFHALDYNDKSTISGWSMPSSRYINLTLGASGSTYTAPANGYFYVKKNFTTSGQYIWFELYNSTDVIMDVTFWGSNSGFIGAFIPVSKGNKVVVNYNATGDTKKFRFIYAEGDHIIQ